ncbi:MAG: hypothetical protein U0787_12600 [Polyangia bacterium]
MFRRRHPSACTGEALAFLFDMRSQVTSTRQRQAARHCRRKQRRLGRCASSTIATRRRWSTHDGSAQRLRPGDIIAELPTFGIPSNTLSPWIWVGIDDFRSQSERDAFRRAERQATEKLKDQRLEFRKRKSASSACTVTLSNGSGQGSQAAPSSSYFRRFGSILNEKNPAERRQIIHKMMESVRCE